MSLRLRANHSGAVNEYLFYPQAGFGNSQQQYSHWQMRNGGDFNTLLAISRNIIA